MEIMIVIVQTNASARRAITLVQASILVVLCGIGVSLIMMWIQQTHEAAARTQCLSNLKQLGIGVHSAIDCNKKAPPVSGYYPGTEKPARLGTVLFHLGLFLEATTIFMVEDSETLTPRCLKMWLFECPADPGPPPTYTESNYAPNYHFFGNESGGSRTVAELPKGGSSTLIFSERRGVCTDGGGSTTKRDQRYGAWVDDTGIFQSGFSSPESGDNRKWHMLHEGINVVMADGGAYYKNSNIDPAVWKSLVIVEKIPPDDPKRLLLNGGCDEPRSNR